MSKRRRSSTNSPQTSLWQWGLMLIIAGPFAYVLLTAIWPLVPPLTNEQRGQAFGRGLMSVLSVIAGVVMLGLHFVRRSRK